jgi:3-isopropylmalate/(R)-2-methylmalate dehydratase small subunit
VIPEKDLGTLLSCVTKQPDMLVTIDLHRQLLIAPAAQLSVWFEINPYKKECLLKGLDDIDYLLGIQNHIVDYEVTNR